MVWYALVQAAFVVHSKMMVPVLCLYGFELSFPYSIASQMNLFRGNWAQIQRMNTIRSNHRKRKKKQTHTPNVELFGKGSYRMTLNKKPFIQVTCIIMLKFISILWFHVSRFVYIISLTKFSMFDAYYIRERESDRARERESGKIEKEIEMNETEN